MESRLHTHVLFLILALLALDVLHFFLHPKESLQNFSPSMRPASPTEMRLTQPSYGFDVAFTIRANLFGRDQSDGPVVEISRTELRLAGVISSAEGDFGYAFIGEQNEPCRLYVSGEQIGRFKRLRSVFSDHVVIENEGTLETLWLPNPSQGALANLPTTTMGVPRGAQVPSRATARRAPQGKLADVFTYSEIRTRNQLQALHILRGKNDEALRSLGLLPGDLVIAVNGSPIQEYESAERVLHSLLTSKEPAVTVVREGRKTDVVVPQGALDEVR
jgi:type II secretion system protein C